MKIDIRRFGPIHQFTYDLEKDLIITYGNNNIGKSYSMQIVYLLLKIFLKNIASFRIYRSTFSAYTWHYSVDGNEVEQELKKLISEFKESKDHSLDITEDITRSFYKMFSREIIHDFLDSCKNTFGNFEKTLEENPVIHITHQQFSFDIILKEERIEGGIQANPVRLKKTTSERLKSRTFKDHLDIYVAADIEQPLYYAMRQVQQKLADWAQAIRSEFSDVHFLPASRSGIYSGMNAFGSIVAELSRNRAFITKKIEFPGISEPISDYFIELSNIKPRAGEQFEEYYSRIEDDILKGKIAFDKNRNALMYKPANVDAVFEMTEVSSMVSEISPIVAFLKFVLTSARRMKNSKSILFIEEPEAHLHPNNQIVLMEIFSQIVDSNIKMVMSSHSNYVFNKLNNLVLDGKLDYRRYCPIILEDRENGSASKELPIDELGANDENFVNVSEQLYFEREEIIQRLSMEE